MLYCEAKRLRQEMQGKAVITDEQDKCLFLCFPLERVTLSPLPSQHPLLPLKYKPFFVQDST